MRWQARVQAFVVSEAQLEAKRALVQQAQKEIAELTLSPAQDLGLTVGNSGNIICINKLKKESAAEAAGLAISDHIETINGVRMSNKEAYHDFCAKARPCDTLRMLVSRTGCDAQFVLPVTVAAKDHALADIVRASRIARGIVTADDFELPLPLVPSLSATSNAVKPADSSTGSSSTESETPQPKKKVWMRGPDKFSFGRQYDIVLDGFGEGHWKWERAVPVIVQQSALVYYDTAATSDSDALKDLKNNAKTILCVVDRVVKPDIPKLTQLLQDIVSGLPFVLVVDADVQVQKGETDEKNDFTTSFPILLQQLLVCAEQYGVPRFVCEKEGDFPEAIYKALDLCVAASSGGSSVV
jgi:hypothetical protein